MNFTKGDVVPFFTDFMNSTGKLGKGLLLEKLAEAPSDSAYILEDMAVAKQEVYGAEQWRLKILELTSKGESFNYKVGEEIERTLGALIYVGVKTSSTSIKKVERLAPSRLIDNFEGVPGWGQQF